ncbi:MAG: glycosyl transferase [Thermodesulfobacteriota bacterium]
MTRHFCTYFDKHYLVRALALYQSLQKHCPSFTLSALCLDPESYSILANMSLPCVQVIALEELERSDPALLNAKSSRSRLDYYFTLTPAFVLMLLKGSTTGDVVTYLDADLYFFRDPEPLFSELQAHSVGIIEHRFPRDLEYLARKFGTFNVAWVNFRNDDEGDACVRWWREQCLTWCYEKRTENRFADQKYLDEWPERFSNLRVLQHKGANLAPWNLRNYDLTRTADGVCVDGEPLLFFHFHRFQRVAPFLYDTNLWLYGAKALSIVRQEIFYPYIEAVAGAQQSLGDRLRGIGFDLGLRNHQGFAALMYRSYVAFRKILNGDYIFSRLR